MKTGKFPHLHELFRVQVGSARYGLLTDSSDRDCFILTQEDNMQIYDPSEDTAYFIWPYRMLNRFWGHPLLLGNLTGDCTGNGQICSFFQAHKREISYAAPECTALFGLDYIAAGEQCGYISPIKAGLRTAMILSHMAAHAEDPFLLSEEEKSILIRSRTGGVSLEERVDIYRRTICPENLDRLMRMPDHPTIKNELFQLIEEVIAS